MTDPDQWPPAHGIPAKHRFKGAATLEWGETPFDDLDRGELLRLVQAYHMAAVSARSALAMLKQPNETSPYWGPDGTGGKALGHLEYLFRHIGYERHSEKMYRSFFRYAGALLFRGLASREHRWGVDDVSGEMFAPFSPGDVSMMKPHRKLRALRWRDLLPKR